MSRSTRTQDEFMNELEQFVTHDGLANWSISQIAARLRCSRRRIYELAPSKDELFLLVARRIFASSLAKCHLAAKAETDVVAAVYAYMNSSVTETRLGLPYITELEQSDAARKLFDEYQQERSRGMVQLLEEGVRTGRFSPFRTALVNEAILGAAVRIRRPGFLARNGLTIEEAFRELYDLILNGLLAKDQLSPHKREQVSAPQRRRRAKTS